jgi:hypothetical protein
MPAKAGIHAASADLCLRMDPSFRWGHGGGGSTLVDRALGREPVELEAGQAGVEAALGA